MRILKTMFPVLLLLSMSMAAAGDDSIPPDSGGASGLAIMPLANYTDSPDVIAMFMPRLENRLADEKLRVVSGPELRQALRKYRIRALGAIDIDDIARIADEIDIRYLMLGSIDFYSDGDIPEAGFSLRLVDASDMKIIWAVSKAASGSDFAGLFGIGRITSMDGLLQKLIDEAFKSLAETLRQYENTPGMPASDETLALVPFDNLSDMPYAGEIVSTYILTDLISRGETVIEPTIVANLFLENAQSPRGQIDLQLLKKINSDLGAVYIITGSVYRFRQAQSDAENSNPEIELAGRCLDSESGRIVAIYNKERDGDQSVALIRINAYRSLGKLTRRVVGDMLNSMEKSRVRNMAGR